MGGISCGNLLQSKVAGGAIFEERVLRKICPAQRLCVGLGIVSVGISEYEIVVEQKRGGVGLDAESGVGDLFLLFKSESTMKALCGVQN